MNYFKVIPSNGRMEFEQTMNTITRPDFVKNEHLKYLDNLRDLGTTNMFGAPDLLSIDFEIPLKEARSITKYWMDSYLERHV